MWRYVSREFKRSHFGVIIRTFCYALCCVDSESRSWSRSRRFFANASFPTLPLVTASRTLPSPRPVPARPPPRPPRTALVTSSSSARCASSFARKRSFSSCFANFAAARASAFSSATSSPAIATQPALQWRRRGQDQHANRSVAAADAARGRVNGAYQVQSRHASGPLLAPAKYRPIQHIDTVRGDGASALDLEGRYRQEECKHKAVASWCNNFCLTEPLLNSLT